MQLDYKAIFSGHIQRILSERGLSQRDLGRMSGLSNGLLTALIQGKDPNPTLNTMLAIADALAVPLPLLLKPLESDEWQAVLIIASANKKAAERNLPPGYGILDPVVLPEHKIFEVRQWAKAAQKKLNSRQ